MLNIDWSVIEGWLIESKINCWNKSCQIWIEAMFGHLQIVIPFCNKQQLFQYLFANKNFKK